MAIIVYRMASRLDAVAAAHMLRSRGHAAELPPSSVADDGNTLIVRVNGDSVARVLTMVEHMFPGATRSPDPTSKGVTDGV